MPGTIPSEMGLLTDLEWLEIRETRMAGSLPSELGRLSNLGYFFVRENAFDGSLPTEFDLLTSLKSLALMKCVSCVAVQAENTVKHHAIPRLFLPRAFLVLFPANWAD